MQRGRPGRALLTLMAVAGFVALPAAPVAAAGGCPPSTASVVVHFHGGTQVVTAADLCPYASVDATYQLRAQPAGSLAPIPISAGVPISVLLQDVLAPAVDPDSVTFTGAVRGDGTWSALTNSQITSPTAFADGLVPVVEVNGDSLNYLRPLTESSSDTNVTDYVTTQPGVPLQLFVGTGPLLTVTITQSASTVEVGQRVTFTASSTPQSPSTSYLWDFGDGRSATGAVVTHEYDAAGGYAVLAQATGGDGAVDGESAPPLYMTVGDVSPSPDPSATPTGGHSPSSSPRPGSSSPAPSPSSGTPTPQPSPSTSAPDGSGSAGPLGSASPSPTASAVVSRPAAGSSGSPTPSSVPVHDGQVVHGRVIGAGAIVLSADGTVDVQAAVAPGGRLAWGWRAARLAGSIAAIMLLFAVGAARERRWARRSRSVVRAR